MQQDVQTCRSSPNPERYIAREEKVSAGKLHATQYLVVLVLAVLAAGMWRLQILGADSYRVLAEANRIRKDPVRAPRGKIFDREGRILVDNYPSVSCYLLREQVKDLQADIPLIARGLDLPGRAGPGHPAPLRQLEPKYESIPLKQDITPDEQAFIEAHRNELPELETRDEQRRLYPRDGFAAHLIGYVGEVSEEDLNSSKFDFYEPGDVVGKSGVEETYDSLLRGTDGSRDVIVNSHGKEVGQLGQQLAIPGHDLRLTIDLDLQRVAEQAMEGKNGALVAMDPHTGEILAMVSRPTFDPNQFAVRLTKSYWSQIITDPDHPLMNKAIQAQLAPGSTFKIIMSLAGLAGERRPGHARHVQRRRHLLRPFLRLRQAPRHGGHRPRHPLVLRHLLLHAGGEAGHRHHRQVRDRSRPLAEDRHRPARRGHRHHALHRSGR